MSPLMAMLACLALLGSLGASAAEDLQSMHREFWRTHAAAMGTVADIQRLVRKPPPDAEQRLDSLLLRYDPQISDLKNTRDRFQARVNEAEALALAKGVAAARKGAAISEKGPTLLLRDQYTRMEAAVTDVETRHRRALALYSTRLQERQERLRKRNALLRVCAVVFLLASGMVLFFLIGRSQAPPPAAVPSLPPAPQTIGGTFSVSRVLGHGGMGVVFEAVDSDLGRKVAIKKLREELAELPKERERFLEEARLVASLKHPNVVEIYSIVQDAQAVYLVFEFVEGWSLARILAERGKLPFRRADHIVHRIALALDYAHERNIIHRDLKPANVMISPEDEVKVMDFGIAYQAKQTIARLTRAKAWGTPPYMAPEQELGAVSRGVDLFALSVCAYEMMTGALPFTGPNFLAQKREEVYAPASDLEPGLPPGIDAFFKRALSADPKKRFSSGAEFASAMRSLQPAA